MTGHSIRQKQSKLELFSLRVSAWNLDAKSDLALEEKSRTVPTTPLSA
jgi:hypothetical protein